MVWVWKPRLICCQIHFSVSYLWIRVQYECGFEMFKQLFCVDATYDCCRRFPSSLANLSNMDVYIKDAFAKITANLNLLNSVFPLPNKAFF